MDSGDLIRCTACDAVVTVGSPTCGVCGSGIDPDIRNSASPLSPGRDRVDAVAPEEPTRTFRPVPRLADPPAEEGASQEGSRLAAPGSALQDEAESPITPAGLPVRRPTRGDEDALREAFARSWEPSERQGPVPSWAGPRRAAAEPDDESEARNEPVAPRVSRLNAFVQATASARAAEPFATREPLDETSGMSRPLDEPPGVSESPGWPAEPPTTLVRAADHDATTGPRAAVSFSAPPAPLAYQVPSTPVSFTTPTIPAAPEFSSLAAPRAAEPLEATPASISVAFIEPLSGTAPAGIPNLADPHPVEPPQPAEPPRPAEPPQPAEPPAPPEPPEPAEPPRPPEPPEPPEPVRPPQPPTPTPEPTPFPKPVPTPDRPVPPGPEPLPDPFPPVPEPPLPTPPPSPVPNPPIPSPVPSPPPPVPTPPPPFPSPPPPVPPPPAMTAPVVTQASVTSVTEASVTQAIVTEASVTEAIATQAIAPQPVPAAPDAGPSPSRPDQSGAGVYRGGTYGQSTAGVMPSQRATGTVYGGQSGLPTSANPEAPIEASGSLTGLILSRGESGQIRPTEQRSRLTKVLVVGLGAIVFVSVIALIVATMAGDIISAVFRGLLG